VGRQSWIEDKEQAQEFSNFISYCQPGMVFFDVGAHFGFFSFAALHYGGIDAKAVAIDPSPVSKRMMKILATLNNFAGRLCLIHASASDHVGEKPMVATGVITDGYFVEPFQSHTATDITLTPTITLDTLSEELKVVPTHIKIDVEGQELSVLRGAKKVLSQSQPPLLFLELHNQIIRDRGGDPSEPLSLLKDFGYDLFDAQGNALDDPEILRCNLIRIMARSSANR